MAVLVLGLAACSGNPTELAATPTPALPQSTETASASPSNPEDLIIVDDIPTSAVEAGMFAALTQQQQARLVKLENLSVEEFRALPDAEQVAFAQFVYDNNLPILAYRLDQMGRGDIDDIGDPNSPEGMVKKKVLVIALMSSLKTYTDADGIGFDSVTARKLTVLLTNNDDELGIQRTAGIDEGIATWNVNTPPIVSAEVVTASRVNADGSVIISLHSPEDGLDFQNTFSAPQTFTTITGADFSIHRQLLSVNSGDPRYVPLQ